MLDADENNMLTCTGPGTPMGELLRRYWVPALLSEELPDPSSPPVRTKLMGERLVAFRRLDGAVGLIDEYCAHRCVSLFFGRAEEDGIRCPYHGWKYDIDGRCIEMPSEPPTSKFKDRIQLRSYPCRERGGVIWAYMGPPGAEPALAQLEWSMVPDDQVFISKRLQNCNFAQAMEGGIDSSHVSILHSDIALWNPTRQFREIVRVFDDTAPRFFVEPTDYGLLIAARRNTPEGTHYYWRITQWVMPWYTFIPPDGDSPIGAHAWVPIDDEHCWSWSINYHPDRKLAKRELDSWRAGGGIHALAIPGTFAPVQSASNDYLINRDIQRSLSFSGIKGIAMQDAAMQESMGDVVDRKREHLGRSDLAIVTARRRLLGAALALSQGSNIAPGTDPLTQRVRSASKLVPVEAPWVEATQDARAAKKEFYVGV